MKVILLILAFFVSSKVDAQSTFTINFRTVVVGTTADTISSIENLRVDSVYIRAINSIAPFIIAASDTGIIPGVTDLNPPPTKILSFGFAPNVPGHFSKPVLVLFSAGSSSPPDTIVLTGTAVAAADVVAGLNGTLQFTSYPNPATSSIHIAYSIPEPSTVTLAIYDELGTRAADLIEGMENAGQHMYSFDSKNLPIGNYFCRLGATVNGQPVAASRRIIIER